MLMNLYGDFLINNKKFFNLQLKPNTTFDIIKFEVFENENNAQCGIITQNRQKNSNGVFNNGKNEFIENESFIIERIDFQKAKIIIEQKIFKYFSELSKENLHTILIPKINFINVKIRSSREGDEVLIIFNFSNLFLDKFESLNKFKNFSIKINGQINVKKEIDLFYKNFEEELRIFFLDAVFVDLEQPAITYFYNIATDSFINDSNLDEIDLKNFNLEHDNFKLMIDKKFSFSRKTKKIGFLAKIKNWMN